MVAPGSEAQPESIPAQNLNKHAREDPQQNPHSDSQSFQTLTLESHHSQIADQPLSLHTYQNHQNSLEFEKNHDDPEGIYTQSTQPSQHSICQRGTKKKKAQKRRPAEEKKLMLKLEVLNQNVKPIPFVPSINLDLSSRQMLFERLGLWEFVNIQFDRNIRSDFLVQVIAMFDSNQRCSYVNGLRVKVNRADLARALKLPVKKTALPDAIEELPASSDSIGFILGFVNNWVLLHDDTWMIPESVHKWIQAIKDGNFGKVDWASMIWFMVEKELVKEQQLTSCYYASHLQCLIKSQHGVLFGLTGEEPQVSDTKTEEQEEEEDNWDVKMEGDAYVRSQGVELEECHIELSLCQDKIVEKIDEKDQTKRVEDVNMMDVEGCDEEEPDQLLLVEPLLKRCNLGEHTVIDLCDDEEREDEGVGEEGHEKEGGGENGNEGGLVEMEGYEGEEEEQQAEDDPVEELGEEYDGGFNLLPKGIPVQELSSGNLVDQMESAQMHLGNSLHFDNGIKREEIRLEIDESLNGNKLLRMDGPWNSRCSSEFDVCMEQKQHWMAKAKMPFAANEQVCDETTMSHQFLLSQLQERDGLIAELQKAKMEEQHKTRVEMYRLERELCLMENLLEGYRKAMKETRNAFAEYRARCPQLDDEPLYEDVAGSGGLVLTKVEIEKQRLKLEEEQRLNRLMIEKKIEEDFEMWWDEKFKDYNECVETLSDKLASLDGECRLLKESFANRRVSETTTFRSVENDL